MLLLLLLLLFVDIRNASRGRGPTTTQRLLLRLLLSGHSVEEFAGGHATTAAASADTAEPRGQCACIGRQHQANSSSVAQHLEACAASASLLSKLLLAGGGATSTAAALGGFQGWGLQGGPSPESLEALLHRISANAHSIVLAECPGGPRKPPHGACPCCEPGSEAALGLYGQPLCRFNHSCLPNALVLFGGPGGPLEISVVASRSIMAGEEVCISYISPADTREARRSKLYLSYAFYCTCVLCCSCPSTNSSNGNRSGCNRPQSDSSSSSNSNINRSPCNGCMNPRLCSSTTRSRSNSRSTDDVSIAAYWSPAEAFDLQLQGVFCRGAACTAVRRTAEGDVLLHLEEALLRRRQQKGHQAGGEGGLPLGAPRNRKVEMLLNAGEEDSRSQGGYFCRFSLPEGALQGLEIRIPVLCMQSSSGVGRIPVQLSRCNAGPPVGTTVIVAKEGASATGAPLPLSSFQLLPEALAKASHLGAPRAAPLQVCCCLCGAAYTTGEMTEFIRHLEELQKTTNRMSRLCCSGLADEAIKESRGAMALFAAVQMYLHPGNIVLQHLAERLSLCLDGMVSSYKDIGLAVSQHLSLASRSLFGASSLPYADRLLIEGRMLLFLSQADSNQDARDAWAVCTAGNPAAAEGMARKECCPLVTESAEETDGETRAKLVYQARECFLHSCSVYFSLEGTSAERLKGRMAEEGVADCHRELDALNLAT